MAADKPPEKSKFWKWLKALTELPVLNTAKVLTSLEDQREAEEHAELLREVYAHVQEIRAQLPRHEDEVVAELARQGVADVTPAEVERQVELMAYRGCLLRMAEYQYVDSAGIASLERAVTLRLEEAYVDLEFVAREWSVGPEREERELVERLERGDLAGDEREAAERQLAEMSVRFRPEEQRLSVGEVLRNRQVVVLGDPGSGKTTLVRYLTQTYALGPETVRERLGTEEDLVPIVIAAARFAKALDDKPRLHLWQFIREEVAALGCEEACGELALAEMQAGRAIILIDGLDEIPEVEQRIAVAKCVGELLAQCPDCRFVITSRIIGYGLSRVAGPQHAELAPFSDDQVREFARKWWRAFEQYRHPEAPDYAAAEREAETLAETIFSSPKVLDLARNPLMIALTAIVQHQEGSLPDRRVELYDKALRMLVETWNRRRSLSAVQLAIPEGARLDYYDFCEVWAPIAFWMHETQPTAGVHTVDLRNRLVKQLGDRLPDGKTAEATADSYIDAAARHTGLLRERGADRWSFFHQTFQEYLAAQEFVRLVAAAPAVLNRATDPRWREVTRLAVGYVGVIQRNSQGAEGILNRLLETGDVLRGDAESPERHTYRHLLLVAGCIADQPRVSGRLENEVLGRLLDACEGVGYDIAHQALCDALKAMDHVRPGAEVLTRCRSWVIESPSWRIRQATACLLSQSPRDPDNLDVLLSACEGLYRAPSDAVARMATADNLPLLISRACDPNPGVRLAVAGALGGILGPDDLGPLFALAEDDDFLVRDEAARSLARVAAQHRPGLVEELASHERVYLRSAAAAMVERVRPPRGLELLRQLARDDEPEVRAGAAWALVDLVTPEDRHLALELMRDEDGTTRAGAAQAFAKLAIRDDWPLLLELMGDENGMVCYGAARGIARLAGTEDLRELSSLAYHPEELVVHAVAETFSRLAGVRDRELLGTLARDEHWGARYVAVRAFGRIPAQQDLPLLQALARDPNLDVRRAVVKALAKVLTAEELRGMYEEETEEWAKETYFMGMWYAVHGEG
ncbi:MAG: NACHT domain-containing protein [Armatimonadetes bacterium]|nr:NACHT domain-containing protein [Armatimonadota bacterium]